MNDDGNILQLSEVTGVPGFAYDFTFGENETVSTTALNATFKGYYSGTDGHNVKLRQWKYSAPAGWDNVTVAPDDFPENTSEQTYVFALINNANYISGGQIKLQLYHGATGITSHKFYLDQLILSLSGSSASPSASPSSSPSASPSISPSPSASPSISPSVSPSISPSVSQSASPSSSPSASPSASPSVSASASPSASPSASQSASPSVSPSISPSPSPSPSPSASPSAGLYDGILYYWDGLTWVKTKLDTYKGGLHQNQPLKMWDGVSFIDVDNTG